MYVGVPTDPPPAARVTPAAYTLYTYTWGGGGGRYGIPWFIPFFFCILSHHVLQVPGHMLQWSWVLGVVHSLTCGS